MKWKIFIATLVMLFGLISGCVEQQKDDDTPDVTVEKGFVDFQVTDKVTEDFDHVNVTFSEIRLFIQDDENESYIVAVSEPKTVDLISLNLSHINASLGIAEIETGNYSKLC